VAVIDDIVVGTRFADLLEDLDGTPFHFVMLRPRVDVLSVRERVRGSDDWETRRHIEAGIEFTPRAGLWLDTSGQTAEETVQEILLRRSESLVDPKVRAEPRQTQEHRT
jgi:chloramphenicol 3-O-phosphotransferase